MDYKPYPTLRPANDFNVDKDITTLREAMKGFGTDKQTIIAILTARSNEQRQELKEYYNNNFERDLIADLKNELGGKLKDLIKALMMPSIEYLCKRMHDAMKYVSWNRAENVLIEILFVADNDNMPKIISCYKDMYNRSITEDIRTLTTVSDMRPLLTILLAGERECAGTMDDIKALQQTEELLAVGSGALNPKESTFHCMLAQASLAQLRLVFKNYNELAGHSVHEAIKRGMEKHPEMMLAIGELIEKDHILSVCGDQFQYVWQ